MQPEGKGARFAFANPEAPAEGFANANPGGYGGCVWLGSWQVMARELARSIG